MFWIKTQYYILIIKATSNRSFNSQLQIRTLARKGVMSRWTSILLFFISQSTIKRVTFLSYFSSNEVLLERPISLYHALCTNAQFRHPGWICSTFAVIFQRLMVISLITLPSCYEPPICRYRGFIVEKLVDRPYFPKKRRWTVASLW